MTQDTQQTMNGNESHSDEDRAAREDDYESRHSSQPDSSDPETMTDTPSDSEDETAAPADDHATDTETSDDETTTKDEILEMLAELDELTGDGGGDRIYPDDYHVSHLESYIEHDGVRITWEPNEDEFVRIFSVLGGKTSHNFNVGPYSVDWKETRRDGGLSVVHRDDHPEAYEQTADRGNYFDDWDGEEDTEEQVGYGDLQERDRVRIKLADGREIECLVTARNLWYTYVTASGKMRYDDRGHVWIDDQGETEVEEMLRLEEQVPVPEREGDAR